MTDAVVDLGAEGAGEALLTVLARVKEGDFTARMPLDWTGVSGKVADGLNDIIIANQVLEKELARVSECVGTQGRLSQRVAVGGNCGRSWSAGVESVNSLIEALIRPTSEMQRVIGAVAGGDLSKHVASEVNGEMLELKNTINGMVDQLTGFISEVTRVIREVGTEGKLDQAAARTVGVGGVWNELTENVNLMASNLAGQIRNIAEVNTAVANGDLSKKFYFDAKGEFLELKNTLNAKVDKLQAISGEVTRVAREVGVEGKLGGQARSNELGGVWRELTDNVNQLAANFTRQVRAIAEVATAVTQGDLTRQVSVEARGEVAVLRDALNEMINNLRETTKQNYEQDWLKTHRERFMLMLQGHRDLATVSSRILSELAPLVSAQHGIFYSMIPSADGDEAKLELQSSYGFEERRRLSSSFRVGEGLVGQCAKEGQRILLTEVPGDYIRINSGLGASTPINIVVLPILFEGSVRAVVELASFSVFSPIHLTFLDQLAESIGTVLNSLTASTVTETLLKQAQSLAEELRTSNEDLEKQASLLAEKNIEAEQRNREAEESKGLLEEKAGQLSLSSKYKSEFMANMSHELRTPLNSLLMLAEQLENNADGNMSATEVEYASVIRSSGNDLLNLLNGILDLAKVESGTMEVAMADVSLEAVCRTLRSEYEPVAKVKGLEFSITLDPSCPAHIVTDVQRLRQILKNLLANAFKFTADGGVHVGIGSPVAGWSQGTESLMQASSVVAFSVRDTGIGIEPEAQRRVFEEFAQGDGSTARMYGGTGLGLSISRRLVGLLHGEIAVTSTPGEGSTFTVYLPQVGPQPDVATPGPVTPTARRPVGLVPVDLGGTNVLVVDDDFRNLFAMTALLERGGAQVVTAESGADAISLLGEGRGEVDMVLMDIMMPVMDGYDAIRAIRKLDGLADLPIIAVTGKVISGERERCMAAGANDYVAKPVDTNELMAALGPWLQPVAPASR